jgi:hypothetical protein
LTTQSSHSGSDGALHPFVAVYLPTAVTLAMLCALAGWMLWRAPAPRVITPDAVASSGQGLAPALPESGDDAELHARTEEQDGSTRPLLGSSFSFKEGHDLAGEQDGSLRPDVAGAPVGLTYRTYLIVGSAAEAARARTAAAGDTRTTIVIVAPPADHDRIVAALREQSALRSALGLSPAEVIDLRSAEDSAD